MAVGKKFDYAPLLAPGRHVLDMQALYSQFVERFSESTSRASLFTKLEKLISIYRNSKIPCEVWVDGSFLTEKPEPNDIDVAIIVEHETGKELNAEQKELIIRTGDDSDPFIEGLDSFAFVRLAQDDPLSGDEYVDGACTWHEQFGVENSGEWLKGFAVIELNRNNYV